MARWNDLPTIAAIVLIASTVTLVGVYLTQYKLLVVRFVRVMRGKPDRGFRRKPSVTQR
jgi:hypothetical protein